MNFTNDEWFVIKDLKTFVNHSRTLVFNNFGTKENDDNDEIDTLIDLSQEEKDDLDRVLSHNESLNIIKSFLKKQKNKKTQQIRYIINDTLYLKALESLGERMTSNILHGLVNKGLIDMAFDDDSNDFIFWVKDNENKKDKEKPETD